MVDADRAEAQGFMETDACRVGQGYAGVDVVKALKSQNAKERGIKCPADPHPAMRLANIGGRLNRPPGGRALAMLACISIAKDCVPLFHHQTRKSFPGDTYAARHFFRQWRVGLKRHRTVRAKS